MPIQTGGSVDTLENPYLVSEPVYGYHTMVSRRHCQRATNGTFTDNLFPLETQIIRTHSPEDINEAKAGGFECLGLRTDQKCCPDVFVLLVAKYILRIEDLGGRGPKRLC